MFRKLQQLLFPIAFVPLLTAQTWVEAGDANNMPRTAQVPVGSGSLTQITGSVNGDVDMFLIQIDNPATFSASTVGSQLADTQLFLFDPDGRSVTHCDDVVIGSLQAVLAVGCVRYPGRYYLAVTPYDIDPTTPLGLPWLGTVHGTHAPEASGRHEEITGWTGSGPSGNYAIHLTGASFANRQLVLPNNCNLTRDGVPLVANGWPWWPLVGSRQQILFDAAQFTGAGVNSAVTIDRLMFRAADGVPDVGGASWANVVVQVGSTSLTAATLSTSFATNLAAATTLLGTPRITTLATLPSSGATPNSDNLVINLAAMGAAFTHDPAGSRPNLLIDLTFPTPPTITSSGSVSDAQTASGGGRTLVANNPAAATGTLSGGLPVMTLQFAGSTSTAGQNLILPARNESIGAACGGFASTFYQLFLNGQRFDLRGLRLTPDSASTPTVYTVTTIDTPPDTGKAMLLRSQADDATTPCALGFTFAFPSGSTTTISPSTNGEVWLANVTTGILSGLNSHFDLLNGSSRPARLMPCWYDFDCSRNVPNHPLSGLYAHTDWSQGAGHGVCYVTWLDIGVYHSSGSGAAMHTMQCVIEQATGAVEFRYGPMPKHLANNNGAAGAAVGFTPAGNNVQLADPQSRDLSLEVPFTTGIEGGFGNLGLRAVTAPIAGSGDYGGRLFAGQSVTWNAIAVPPGSLIGAQLVDITATRPGLQLPTITASGCSLGTTSNALVWEFHVLPSTNQAGSTPFTVPAGHEGFEIVAQYVVLNGLFGAPTLVTSASNTLRHTLGLQ